MNGILRNKWQLVGLGWVLLSLLLILEYVIPEVRSTSRITHELHVQQGKIESVQNWENRLDILQKRRNHLQDYFSKIYVSFPSDDQMSAIVALVYNMGKKAGISLQQMRPGSRKEYESHVDIPITLEMEGSYAGIGRFVNLLERSKYLIKMQELHLSAPDEIHQDGEKTMRNLRAKILLRIIILKSKQHKQSDSDA